MSAGQQTAPTPVTTATKLNTAHQTTLTLTPGIVLSAQASDVFMVVEYAVKGAGERDRTADLPFTRRLLCQLSYTGAEPRAW